MGRRPSPKVAELKAQLRHFLDEALAQPIGLVIHADALQYVLRIAKQVKKEEHRWSALMVRPGTELDEIWLIKKEPDVGSEKT